MKKFIILFLLSTFSLNFKLHAIPLEGEEEVAGARSGAVVRALAIGTTYGVLAGAFLGIASIAFVDRPSQNLRNIAMGASLGLYAGILFGGYLAWSTFSSVRPETFPTEEDYDTLDYETYYLPTQPLDLPKVSKSQLFFANRASDIKPGFVTQIPIFQYRFF